MAIITISRQLGSFGTEIAKKLQEELHYSYLDKQSLEEELVHKYGISEKKSTIMMRRSQLSGICFLLTKINTCIS